MLSKCANPACSEKFLHLQQGKLFHLSPTSEVEAAIGGYVPWFHERFWLCDRCSKTMTLVWGGTEVRLVPLPEQPPAALSPELEETEGVRKARRHGEVHEAVE